MVGIVLASYADFTTSTGYRQYVQSDSPSMLGSTPNVDRNRNRI